MKESRKGFVEIPRMTLNALKGLLFSNDEGVDLSSIINDLTPNEEMRDLIAINVALTYKGMKPKLDNTTRYDGDYRTIKCYEFTSYSLILGVVNCKVVRERLPYDNNKLFTKEDFKSDGESFETIGIDTWLELSTDKDSIQKSILERINKDYKPNAQ